MPSRRDDYRSKLKKSPGAQEEPSTQSASGSDYWKTRPERTHRLKIGYPFGSKPDIYVPVEWTQEDIEVAMAEQGVRPKPFNQVERFEHTAKDLSKDMKS